MMENNYFFKKTYIKTQSKKRDVLLITLLQGTKNSNLYNKNYTLNVKCHI